MSESYPGYLGLYKTGELQQRAEQVVERLRSCRVCPWECEINRLKDEKKVCRTGRYARVTSAFPHHGEEDPIRGSSGSGTIFFGWCNLRCVFCQNYSISHTDSGREVTPDALADMMLSLQERGCHNINFVTPEHVVPQILEALVVAADRGLHIPLVYNTGGYDSMESLQLLDGVVDIYMPDFKYWTAESARRYLKSKDYPEVVKLVVKEMHRQVGDLELDSRGIARRGLLVRHLLMPDAEEESRGILQFLASEVSQDTYINIMGQYHPNGEVGTDRYPELNRRITRREITSAFQTAREAGLSRFDRDRPAGIW